MASFEWMASRRANTPLPRWRRKLYAAFPDSTVTLQEHACAEVDWSTRLDGHIRGHVYFSDGTPAAGVYLTAKAADSDPHEPWTWQATYATAAADGSFDFAQLAPALTSLRPTSIFPRKIGKAVLPAGILPWLGPSGGSGRHYRGGRRIHRKSAVLPAARFRASNCSGGGDGAGLRWQTRFPRGDPGL